MADGDEQTIIMCQRVWLFLCEKMGKEKKLQCLQGRAMAEESFAVVEIYVSLEAAMGMMAADRDESTIVVFVCL